MWTPDMEDVLRTMRADGHSSSMIAAAIRKLFQGVKVTRNAVIGKAARLCLPAPARPSLHSKLKRKPGLDGVIGRRIKKLRNGPPSGCERRGEAAGLTETLPAQPHAPEHWLTFDQLKPRQCRYPMGEGAAMRFCGNAQLIESSYCEHHHRITHTVEGPRRKGGFQLGLKMAAGRA